MTDEIGTPGTMVWLGHGSLLLTTNSGTRVVFDPWLEGNPAYPFDHADLGRVDAIAVTHGHFDHIGSVESLAAATGAAVISTPELSAYFGSIGLENLIEMNKGGSVEVGNLRLTMVAADHSCGVSVGERQPNVYGGDPVGFIAQPTDVRSAAIYVSGDTNVFGDMSVIRELYRPEIGFFPIDGHYNMGAREAAYAVELLGLRRAVPIHFGTFPLLAGTPAELADELAKRQTDVELVVIQPGGTVTVFAEEAE
jgi:L-ascorbate metabolism protein UlaG (beta-lactamase superfamily)